MSYRRFLRNIDYRGIISDNHLMQISENYDEIKFEQAESDSEICITEYLTVNYAIEEAFKVGKMILDYNPFVNYPAGVYFWNNDIVYKTIREIAGAQRPASHIYWEVINEPIDYEATILSYTQTGDYYIDDIVLFGTEYYRCVCENGMSFNDIRIPNSVNFWVETLDIATETYTEGKLDYEEGNTISYDGKYFTASSIAVNGTQPVEYLNVTKSDPRNANIRKHMARLSLYELCKAISPNNISNTVLNDWEYSMKWLSQCNKMTITPTISRKVDGSGKEVSDWVIGEFGEPVSSWYI